ncbi:hypothetical protein WICMUC_004420 [Wickerhamomyces mucosus]|uniref:MPN domain-containing protein n=1 Tax=Wickerhamomyces mucosus TaxID=1378264 RepID=A0A9P8PHP8_9ASCO|nr:hypothetical protein WICMUC_004420 [Wickerhamomyces mucosus]
MSQGLNIVRPNLAQSFGAVSSSPITVLVQSPALFQILEFALRSENGQKVIGTLVGQRSDDGSEIEVRDAYIVPHRDEGDEVTIEEYHHRSLFQLHKRSHPKDSILGWFSTSPQIDSFTSLVHDFYSRSSDGTYPHPAVHLTLDHDLSSPDALKQLPTLNTYIGSPIGASIQTAANLKIDKGSSYLFTSVSNEVTFDAQEKSLLNYSSRQVFEEKESIDILQNAVDLNSLSEHLNKIDLLISSTLAYIEKIENKQIEGDEKFAKFLLSNLKTNIDSVNLEDLEKTFNSHIQDVLMVEYLTSSIKTQLELSAKLATLV